MPDYQFYFDDIVDGFSHVNLVDKLGSKTIDFDVSIEDNPIYFLSGRCLSTLEADLLDLATAIHFADKLAMPRKNRIISVHVILRLRNYEIFNDKNSLLQDLLSFYTGDHWTFEFRSRKSPKRQSEHPLSRQMSLPSVRDLTEFALWSGGLDSLAGLQNRLLRDGNKNFVLIGTGSNNIMRKTQQQVFQSLYYLPHSSGRMQFAHIPINGNYGGRYSQNQSHRARGIVFLLVGVACALNAGQNKLHVYETGIGAINLPYPGGVGSDHSKAVHPISLIKLERFISDVNSKAFMLENPFIFATKAEMCSSLKSTSQLIAETISCDRLHRERYIQCGFCSSCILRRQALASAGIRDQTKYLIPYGKKPQSWHLLYWQLMDKQVQKLDEDLSSPEPFFYLGKSYSSDLPDIVSNLAVRQGRDEKDIERELVRLFRTYVREWKGVANSILSTMKDNKYCEHYLEDKKWQQMQLIN